MNLFVRNLLIISALLVNVAVEAQVVTTSYSNPCTGETKVITVPSTGQTVVTIYNQTRVVTAQDITSGVFTSWIASAFQSYSALSPCSQSEAQTQATNQAVQQTAQEAAKAATAAATAAPQPVPAAPTPPPPTQTTAPTTSTPNTTTNGNNQNTSSGSTAQSSNQGSTDSGNTSGGGTDNSSSSSGTDGSSGDTSQDSQGSTESQGSEDQNSQSSESNNQEGSSSSEGGEDQSSEDSSTAEESTTEESSSEDTSDSENSEAEGGDSEESTESEQESEEVEEKEESSEKEESEEESEEESTDEEEESTEEEEEEEEEKKNTNPPIVIANISTMQGLDGSYSAAMTFGVSRSSMRGDKNYGVTSMVWSNLKQYMLMGSFSKTFFIKGKPKLVYSAGLMGGKMFTTLMGGVNNSLVYLSSKGSVYGLSLGATTIHLNYQIKKANILVDQSLLSGTATGFWTKSYNFDRYSLSPMLAVSSPFITRDIYDRTTTYNKDLTFITGVSGNYNLTQRFVLNLGVNATHNTNKQIRSLLNFTIGSRFSF